MATLLLILKIIGVTLLVLLSLLAALTLSLVVKSNMDADKLLHGNRYYGSFTRDLLRTSYRQKNVLHNVTIPYNPMVPSDGIVTLPNVLICRGGVIVIGVLPYSGALDNPIHGNWLLHDNRGTTVLRDASEDNDVCVRAVRNMLKADGLNNITVHNLLVYTDPSLRLRRRDAMIVPCEKLLANTRTISKEPIISVSVMPRVQRCFEKYRIRPQRMQQIPPQQMVSDYPTGR